MAHSAHPPSTSEEDRDSSDSASSFYSADSADSEAELDRSHHKRRKKRRRKRFAATTSDSDDSSTTWILVLGFLVVLAAGVAAYLYVQKDAAGLGSSSSGTEEGATESTANRGAGSSSGSSRSAEGSGSGESEVEGASKTTSAKSSPSSGGSNTAGSPSTSSNNPPSSTEGSSSPTGSLKCRKGIGHNDADLTQGLDICWAYNWDSKGSGLKDGVMYIPMLWGTKKLDGWEAAVNTAIQNGATHVLGFNEPDLAEQANLSPSAAASIWSSAMEPLATKNVKLVSPAVSNGVKTADGKPMGVPWLLEFFDACKDCTIDAVALHWYDTATNLEYFQKYIGNAHANISKPIWLTEFMGTGSATDQASFISSSVEWLEQQDYIEAYAAFGDFCDNPIANFVDCDGKTNDLGKAYSDAK
ncbi:hypothetical protein JCM16303_002257 [Sporobolomyces ruberrimus]